MALGSRCRTIAIGPAPARTVPLAAGGTSCKKLPGLVLTPAAQSARATRNPSCGVRVACGKAPRWANLTWLGSLT